MKVLSGKVTIIEHGFPQTFDNRKAKELYEELLCAIVLDFG